MHAHVITSEILNVVCVLGRKPTDLAKLPFLWKEQAIQDAFSTELLPAKLLFLWKEEDYTRSLFNTTLAQSPDFETKWLAGVGTAQVP